MSAKTPARILITAALPYANGPAHLGHIAGCYLPADIYARYQRLMGRDVVFICGSDEHGVPIILRAKADGVSFKQTVDVFHEQLRRGFERLGMSFDAYGRTSSPRHHEISREFFRHMAQKGAFTLKTESQLYDAKAGMFLADRFVRGTCPNAACGNPDAYGDQCEKCGRTLSPKELIDPRSAITDERPELRETTHWFLSLRAMQPWLERWIASKRDWKANVLGQAKSWLDEGLEDRSMTRDLPWGIAVPEDVAESAGIDASGKVMYVWFDAPIGYISITREWAEGQGDPERWKRYWQGPDTKLVHFIGKDNIVFHTLIFPAMLELHGGYVLPEDVPANEFLNLEGQKFSKSRNWSIDVNDALDAFPADYLRYALLCVLPETKDGDFTWKEMQAHVNNELADTLGNFVNRSVAFVHRYLGGVVPRLHAQSALDSAMLAAVAAAPGQVGALLEGYRFREAGSELMGLARQANKYFNDSAPWATRTSDPTRCDSTLHVALQVAATLSILAEPFLPAIAQKMRALLGVANLRSSERAGGEGLGWSDAGGLLLDAGSPVAAPEVLVAKIDDAAIAAQLAKLGPRPGEAGAAAAANGGAYTALGAVIGIDDFTKLDLRVGLVTQCEPVPKSKKLLRCEVDLGFETRQVLAGVAEHMGPADLLGAKVVVVANLAPRTMLGLESRGMLLMAKGRDGKLVPITTSGEPGSTVA